MTGTSGKILNNANERGPWSAWQVRIREALKFSERAVVPL
jgi:hypothetical protein